MEVGPDISDDSFTMMESDEWIFERIAEGYKDMPRFGNVLSDDQIQRIVTFLRFGTETPVSSPTTTTTTAPTTATTEPPTETTSGEPATPSTDDILALGEALYVETFGFDGCQECHGLDMNGSEQGPSILGASRSSIATALKEVPDMEVDVPLTNEEIEAIYQYMTWLRAQR